MSSRDDNAGAAISREGARWPACPACGAPPRRAAALYCATCGRSLREREYRPADGLRASYRWRTSGELSRPGVEDAARRDPETAARLSAPPRPRAGDGALSRRREPARARFDEGQPRSRLTSPNRRRRPRSEQRNEETARAYTLLAYALVVPCLGIVLCPPAFAYGAAGLRRARREGRPRAAREAEQSAAYAVLLFGAHALLWGVLFLVPVWFG